MNKAFSSCFFALVISVIRTLPSIDVKLRAPSTVVAESETLVKIELTRQNKVEKDEKQKKKEKARKTKNGKMTDFSLFFMCTETSSKLRSHTTLPEEERRRMVVGLG